MSYIGSTPANKIVTSSDMEDGVVSTDKLAANAVTTAKITDGTIAEADIANDAVTADKIANAVNSAISANTSKTTNATHSGEVTGSGALTIADNIVDEANLKVSNSPTNGYFLSAQSGNTGGMTWSEAGGGCWTHLLTSTASNSSSIDFNSTYITTTYLDYMIIGSNIKLSTNAKQVGFFVSENNGSSVIGANYYNMRFGYDTGGSSRIQTQNGDSSGGYFTPDEIGNSTGEVLDFTTTFYDPMKQSGTSSRYLGFNTFGQAYTDHPRLMTFTTSSSYAGSTNAINFIRLNALSSNIASGKVSLYGRKIS